MKNDVLGSAHEARGAAHPPEDDPRPDVHIDALLAELEVERECRRADVERRVLAIARMLRGLDRREVNDILERARALARGKDPREASRTTTVRR